jgi:hypothetical protein
LKRQNRSSSHFHWSLVVPLYGGLQSWKRQIISDFIMLLKPTQISRHFGNMQQI